MSGTPALVRVGLPSHLAEGARLAKRIRALLDQRDAAFARVDADFRERMKRELETTADEVSDAVAASDVAEQVS